MTTNEKTPVPNPHWAISFEHEDGFHGEWPTRAAATIAAANEAPGERGEVVGVELQSFKLGSADENVDTDVIASLIDDGLEEGVEVSEAAKADLDAVLKTWARRWLPPAWVSDGARESFTVTASGLVAIEDEDGEDDDDDDDEEEGDDEDDEDEEDEDDVLDGEEDEDDE